MASLSRGTGSEDNDSDFDNQSHEDDIDNEEEPAVARKPAEELINEQEELQKQLIVRSELCSCRSSLICSFRHLDPTAEDHVEHCTGMATKREKLCRTIGENGSSGKSTSNA